jgi:alanine-synthesizing transaminase
MTRRGGGDAAPSDPSFPFSARAEWRVPANRLARLRQQLEEQRVTLLDLTMSNPTRAGIRYPDDELAAIAAACSGSRYQPHPRGLPAARAALAAELSVLGDAVDPDDLFLTASTSEAYSWLFKLLASPGDEIWTAAPTYPLLDQIASLEGVALRWFHSDLGDSGVSGRGWWRLDLDELDTAGERLQAVVAVHPNNPTGSFVGNDEMKRLSAICSRRGAGLIADEVFFDYRLSPMQSVPSSFGRLEEGLVFSLGGLSKSAGLPHWKLGWIRISGERRLRREAAQALELIADTFLSVSSPVQCALPRLLELAPAIRASISARLQLNLQRLQEMLRPHPALQLLPPEGGWSAVLRIPRMVDDEELALELLAERHLLIHPGYFYDFPHDGFLVVSLLVAPELFEEGAARMISHLQRKIG